MSEPKGVKRLVERFERNRDAYRSHEYNETQARREFIDPFFKALGWDMYNEAGYAEAYKEVIHEDAIKVGGATKAPDYAFRIGGVRKFFVEAKRPGVNIKDDENAAYQLRRYAWSAKLPLSILTDFEEFAVYDCRVKPAKTDKASAARILYITYTEYAERWDEIALIFSQEAILTGSFDRYVESTKRKRGTAEVDDAFLKEIEAWRDVLARNIALRNADLSTRELNFAVQRTIDRIIFLRICEDRGIEDYGQLMALQSGNRVYPRLCQILRRADERYNSGLFHFRKEKDRPEPPDDLTLSLTVDDKVLKEVFKDLYYPDSPYEFSVLPADILGHIYEQFLGKVIRLTSGHHAKVEDKPEVKKAGGVYYTPTYIVDYIVKNTVEKLLDGKTPQQVRTLYVLDPACGSGSFLLGAYQRLLDWHLQWYSEHDPERFAKGRSPKIFHGPGGDWRLTTSEKKRILLNNIYGVDIDPQAVEVSKLSLLLKVLEGENAETLGQSLRLFHERALPDLADNIKCGNSLIGPDFYEGKQLGLLDEEERYRINAFDWEAEFPEIMNAGGFDAVIGNPPYIRMEMFKEMKQYLRAHYSSHAERTDLYVYFIEKEHDLLRLQGRFGMIVSNKFIRANYGEPLREHLESVATIERIVDLAGLPVFHGATVRTVVLITRKARDKDKQSPVLYSPPPAKEDLLHAEAATYTLAEIADPLAYEVPAGELSRGGWRLIHPEHAALMGRLREKGTPLKEFTDGRICMGIKAGLTKAFVISAEKRNKIVSKNPEAKQIIRPFLQGRQIRRYEIKTTSEFLIYTHHGIDMHPYPAVIEYLRPFRQQLENRATKQKWYELQQPQFAYVAYLEQPKIVFPDIATGCRFALDADGHFGANTVYFIPMSDPATLGLLNSRLAFFFFRQTCAALEGPGEAYLRFFGQYLEDLPVRLPPESDPRRQHLAELVQRMLHLHKQLQTSTTPHTKSVIQRQIKETDRQIDQLVYELYDLTDEEIRIVEETTK